MNYNILRITTLVVLSISLLANAYFSLELGGQDEQITVLEEEMGVLKQQYKVMQRNYEVTKENFDILRQKNIQEIPLQSPTPSNEASAIVYWNQEAQTVYIDADGLPAPEFASKQYQVWVLQKGNYVDLGVFNYQTDVANFFRMKNAIDAEGFAISLEKAQGNTKPTQIVVKANIGGK